MLDNSASSAAYFPRMQSADNRRTADWRVLLTEAAAVVWDPAKH